MYPQQNKRLHQAKSCYEPCLTLSIEVCSALDTKTAFKVLGNHAKKSTLPNSEAEQAARTDPFQE